MYTHTHTYKQMSNCFADCLCFAHICIHIQVRMLRRVFRERGVDVDLIWLQVFEPIIGSDLKMSAEEIEMGLIKPDSSLIKLHITLLKVSFSYHLVPFEMSLILLNSFTCCAL